jgi:hypothetical protein
MALAFLLLISSMLPLKYTQLETVNPVTDFTAQGLTPPSPSFWLIHIPTAPLPRFPEQDIVFGHVGDK